MKRQIAEDIYNWISGRQFAKWYGPVTGGDFDNHICGEENAPTKEEILEYIEKKALHNLP